MVLTIRRFYASNYIVKIKTKNKPTGFKPVVLELTIETRAELLSLFNALSFSYEQIEAQSERVGIHPMSAIEVGGLHSILEAVDKSIFEVDEGQYL